MKYKVNTNEDFQVQRDSSIVSIFDLQSQIYDVSNSIGSIDIAPFIVTITKTVNNEDITYSADKTSSEIAEAIADEKTVIARYTNDDSVTTDMMLMQYEDDIFNFGSPLGYNVYSCWCCIDGSSSSDIVLLDELRYIRADNLATINGSTLVDNTDFELLTSSDLTELNHLIDDVIVDSSYFNAHGVDTFNDSSEKRYIVVDTLSFSANTEYPVHAGSVIAFTHAGMISGEGTLVLNNNVVEGSMFQIFDSSVNFKGQWGNQEIYPEWWGAVGDGVTDDAAAINRCIYNSGHTQVTLTKQDYLVKSTVLCTEADAAPGMFEPLTNAENSHALSWATNKTLHIKGNLIGDETLNDPVLLFDCCQSSLTVDGAIIVRGRQVTSGSTITKQPVGLAMHTREAASGQNIIRINSITKYPYNYPYDNSDSGNNYDETVIGFGEGIGAIVGGTNNNVFIKVIDGFRIGLNIWYLDDSTVTVDKIGATYCILMGRSTEKVNSAQTSIYDSQTGSFNGINRTMTRNNIWLNHIWVCTSTSSQRYTIINAVEDSAFVREMNYGESACNNIHIGSKNQSGPVGQHYMVYSQSQSTVNTSLYGKNTGNKFYINRTAPPKTAFKFVGRSAVQNETYNAIEIHNNVGAYIDDIDVTNVWWVRAYNVNMPVAARDAGASGSLRFRSIGVDSIGVHMDYVDYMRSGYPLATNTAGNIAVINVDKNCESYINWVDTVPAASSASNYVIYIHNDDNGADIINEGNMIKYPVYVKLGSTMTLMGYVNKDVPDYVKNIMPSDIANWNNKQNAVEIVSVTGPTFNNSMAENKMYMFGSTTTEMTSVTITGLDTPAVGTIVNTYQGMIYTGAGMTLTLPNNIKIANDQTLPTFATGHLFEFSILNNILTFTYTTL